MGSSFFDRIDELSDQVGHGHLVAKVEVDQVYAHYQEVGEELRHPRGGRAYALRDALYERNDEHMAALAERAITPDGSDLARGMEHVAEAVGDGYHEFAPVEIGVLRASDHPTVTDDGAVVYDRPPAVARLTEDELRLRHRHLLYGGARLYGPL
jgi:hypothetical protein